MSELEKCQKCGANSRNSITNSYQSVKVYFDCESSIVVTTDGDREFSESDFCKGRAQAIAETEARIAERLKGMVRSNSHDTWIPFRKIKALIQELQPQSGSKWIETIDEFCRRSDSVNDGRDDLTHEQKRERGARIGRLIAAGIEPKEAKCVDAILSDLPLHTPTNVQKEGRE